MGFLSTLLKIAPFVAAPFTGGASLGLAGLGTASTLGGISAGLGQLLGGIEGKRQAARVQANELAIPQAQTDLARRRYALTAPNVRARQGLLADFLSQPELPLTHPRVHVVNFPGISPGSDTLQMVQNIRHNALMNQLRGDQFESLTPEKPGALDTALNIGSFGAGLGNILGQAGVFGKRPLPLPGTDLPGGYTSPF